MTKNINTVENRKGNNTPPGPLGGGHGGPPMGIPGQKANNFKKTIKQLVTYCNAYVPYILFALVLAFVGAAFNVYGPDKLREMTDIIQQGLMTTIDLDAIKTVGLILATLYGLGLVFNYVQDL